jgi:arginyl-tRNA synthetase
LNSTNAFLAGLLRAALEHIGAPPAELALAPPREPGRGDIGTSVALKLAPLMNNSPRTIAENIAAAITIDPCYLERIEIADSGFINFHFTPAFFQARIAELLSSGPRDNAIALPPAFSARAIGLYDIVPERAGSDDDPLRDIRFAHAQIAGLLRHAASARIAPAPDVSLAPLTDAAELPLIKTLLRFPDESSHALANNSPEYLVAYLRDLTATFNHFNHTHRTLSAPPELRDARLRLLQAAQMIFDDAMMMLNLKIQ